LVLGRLEAFIGQGYLWQQPGNWLNIDLVGVQEVRWDKGGTVRAGNYDFFYGKVTENHQFGQGFFVHQRMVSAVKRTDFVSNRVSYI